MPPSQYIYWAPGSTSDYLSILALRLNRNEYLDKSNYRFHLSQKIERLVRKARQFDIVYCKNIVRGLEFYHPKDWATQIMLSDSLSIAIQCIDWERELIVKRRSQRSVALILSGQTLSSFCECLP